MKKISKSLGLNLKHAKAIWGKIPRTTVDGLRELTKRLALSVANGDLQLLDGRWYVTHSGLLRVAQRRRCRGIVSDVQANLSNPTSNSWVFKATVYKDGETTGFVGYGDANPGNVSTLVFGAEMRIAETRAVNRALRKAYGIGLCSVEELNVPSPKIEPVSRKTINSAPVNGNGSTNSHPRLRDRLCLLIRKYELDPGQVKRYAADFCGTEVLRDAGRDLVESFIATLAEQAAKDREALICKLNSYGDTQAVNS